MVNRIKRIFLSTINLIFMDRNEKNFINHNKSLFNNLQNKDNQILIENNNMYPNHIAV